MDQETNNKTENNQSKNDEVIIDLNKLAAQKDVKNSDLILAILEICTFPKRYNYECSNNTKAFWDRVVNEDLLHKIFGNFKSETLKKYWKIIRTAGNNEKYLQTIKTNIKYINNPIFKLLPIINGIAAFVKSDKNNFEEFFCNYNSKDKTLENEENKENKNEIKLLGNKRQQDNEVTYPEKNDVKIEEKKEDNENNELNEQIVKLMERTKLSKEEVEKAMYGTSNNVEHAYLYLTDNKKYDKYFFIETDDFIIKYSRDKVFYKELIALKGEELVKERENFLGIKN